MDLDKENIKLVAKEALKNSEDFEKEIKKQTELQKEVRLLQTDLMGAKKDLNDAHSRLTTDLFDQIKRIKGLVDPTAILEKERDELEQMLKKLEQRLKAQFQNEVSALVNKRDDKIDDAFEAIGKIEKEAKQMESKIESLELFKKNPVEIIRQIEDVRLNLKGVAYLL